MKKNIIISAVVSALTFVLLPLALVFFIGGMDALGILLLLLFTVNPIVSIVIGILSGGEKVLWYLPIINAAIFLIAQSIITGFDGMYILAAIAYGAIGIVAAYIKTTIKNKKHSQN